MHLFLWKGLSLMSDRLKNQTHCAQPLQINYTVLNCKPLSSCGTIELIDSANEAVFLALVVMLNIVATPKSVIMSTEGRILKI